MILPRTVHKVDDTTFYWLSSPSSGGSFDDQMILTVGTTIIGRFGTLTSRSPNIEIIIFVFALNSVFSHFLPSKRFEAFARRRKKIFLAKLWNPIKKMVRQMAKFFLIFQNILNIPPIWKISRISRRFCS